jgi:hypothetical protein
MAKPPITITCDCGAAASVAYGARWNCESCGRTWDTAQIPADEYARLLKSMRSYKLLTVGPPLVAAAALVPLALVVGLQFAVLLFVVTVTWRIFAVPQIRRRATSRVVEDNPKWILRPDQP